MTPVLITAPSADVVSVSALKAMLGLGSETADAIVQAARDAVVGELDPAAGGWLGRSLRPATWELRMSQFPCGKIELPFPPCSAITSIEYDDAAGVEHTLAEFTDYRVFLRPIDKSFVTPIYGGSWPSARGDHESVRIRFVAGYPASPDDMMPKPIVQAIALGVRKLLPLATRDLTISSEEVPEVERVQYVVTPNASAVLESAMSGLLSPYRVWG